MTRVEKAILQEEEDKKREIIKKRNHFIFKIVASIVAIGGVLGIIIYAYIVYQQTNGTSKTISEQVGNIVETPNNKNW